MRQIAAFAAAALLSGCGVWTSTIRSDVLDYSNVIADTSDKFLLINILEARDGAPLQFVEMPKISGSLQATASLQTGVPLELRNVNAAQGLLSTTITPTISVQSTPTFEVDNLDTKEFAQGMTSAIDPKQVKYWIGKGLDKRMLLLLFFSSIKITNSDCGALKSDSQTTSIGGTEDANALQYLKETYDQCIQNHGTSIIVQNDPRKAADALSDCAKKNHKKINECHAITGFEYYLKLIDDMREGFKANVYGERTLVAKNVDLDLKDLVTIDPAKYEVEYVTGNADDNVAADVTGTVTGEMTGKIAGKLTGKLTGTVAGKKSSHYNIYSATDEGKIALCFRGWPIADSDEPYPAECRSSLVTDVTKPQDETDDDAQDKTNAQPDTETILNPEILCDRSSRHVVLSEAPPPKPWPTLVSTPTSSDPYCRIYLNYLNYLEAVTEKFYETNESGKPDFESRHEDEKEKIEAAVSDGDKHYRITVAIRSAGEMVRYLGDVLYYQDQMNYLNRTAQKNHLDPDGHLNLPLTVGFSDDCHAIKNSKARQEVFPDDPNCLRADDGYLFRVNGKDAQRFSVNYGGKNYAVGQASPNDHTLEVLAVLSLSVILNRSASDIQPTQLIQTIP